MSHESTSGSSTLHPLPPETTANAALYNNARHGPTHRVGILGKQLHMAFGPTLAKAQLSWEKRRCFVAASSPTSSFATRPHKMRNLANTPGTGR